MMRLFQVFIFSFTFISMLASSAWACSVCGCGDPLACSVGAHPMADSFRLSLENIYLTASAQSDDGISTESVRQVNLNTTLSYSPTNDWTFSLMLPVVEKYWSLTPPGGPDAGTPFGIGDMMAGARYFFLSEVDFKAKQSTALAVSVGTYLPTGGTNFISQITGANLDTHSQLGTGAWAFYGGFLYNRTFDDFSINANASFIGRTTPSTTDANSPVYKYTFGNSFTGGIQAQLKVADPLAVSFAIDGRDADADRELNDDGSAIIPAPNTGGILLAATPGVWWNISGDATLYAKVQIPFYTHLNGVQEVDPTYTLGTQFLIH